MSSPNQHHGSLSPRYSRASESDMTWEESYRQRVKKMTRDYVNPNSTRLSHRRSRSADSRPQYNTATYRDTPGSSSEQSRSHRVEGLNTFYPILDETRARVVYDATGPQFPSQLPKPVGVDQAYYRPNGTGLSPNSTGQQMTGNNGNSIYQTPSGFVSPFESSSVRKSGQSVNPTLVITPKRHGHDFIKNSLIMFGDDVSSVGTGTSQEELLQHNVKEQRNEIRKEKKERKGLVNMPSALFQPPSTRKLRQNYREEKAHHHEDNAALQNQNSLEQYAPPTPQIHNRSASNRKISGSKARSFDDRELAHRASAERSSSQHSSHVSPQPRTPLPSIRSFDDKDLLRNVSSPDPPAHHSSAPHKNSSASEMTDQRRSQTSSTSRKWTIIPSLSRSRSRSRSPVHARDRSGAFPSPSSSSHGAINAKPTNSNFHQDGNSGGNGSTHFKVDHRRPIDPPPSLEIAMNQYDSIDEGSSRLETSLEKKFDDHLVEPDFSDRDDSPDDFARQDTWDSSFMADEWPSGTESQGYPRSKDGSTRGQYNPQYRSNGAFPNFSTPTTPLAGSLTSESSDYPTDFDPFTSKLSDSEYPMYDKALRKHPQQTQKYSVQSAKSPSVEHLLLSLADQNKAKLAYATTSRLNNPPGLDMTFYTPSKPDAPGTASITPETDKALNKNSSKTSPRSVMDIQNPNVRWSDNLEQLPTPPSGRFQRPKSILKTSRAQNNATNDECEPDEIPTQVRAFRIAEDGSARGDFIPDNLNDIAFVDDDGDTLSPISSFDAGGEPHVPATKGATAFERNIPEEYQRAFAYKNMAYSDYASAAYTDFIEAVAAVVIQTTVRQFLAKIQRHKLRNERDSPTRRAQHKWGQRAARVGKRHVQLSISTRNSVDVNRNQQSIAATRIQSTFRGWYTRDHIAIDNYCATIIQNVFRTYMTRKAFIRDRQRIIKIQALARRRKAFDIYATSMYCIVAIQSAFRGHRVRRSVAQIFHKTPDFIKHVAAAVIQAQWRCFRCEMAFLRAYESILLLQSVARGWVTRRLIRSWMRSRNIKTKYFLKEYQPKPKPKPKSIFSYHLPHGYHNHTAFLRQNIPSPVRNTAIDSLHHHSTEKPVFSSTKSDPGSSRHEPKSHKDSLLEKYRMKRDQSLNGQSQGFQPIERAATGQKDTNHTANRGGTRGPLPTSRTNRDDSIALPNISVEPPRRPSSDTGARSYQRLQNANISMGESVGTMKDLLKRPVRKSKSLSSDVDERKSHDQYKKTLRKSISNEEIRGARHATDALRQSGRSFTSVGVGRLRVTHAASYDIASKPTSSTEAHSEDLTDRKSSPEVQPHIDSSHSSASRVLASWRNREKNSTADQAKKSTPATTHARDSGPGNVIKQASKHAGEHQVLSKEPTSWQEKQSAQFLSRSRSSVPLPTKNQPHAESNRTEEHMQSPREIPFYQRNLRPVNHESQDEKNDDRVGQVHCTIPLSSLSNPRPVDQGRVTTPSLVKARSVEGAAVEPEKSSKRKTVENAAWTNSTFDPLQSKSTVHVEMRLKRSTSEQQRLDSIHALFVRSGLIGRHEKQKISFAHTTSAEYEEIMRDAEE